MPIMVPRGSDNQDETGAWRHTPGASGDAIDSEFVDHCIDCSEAANEWVAWPCSAEQLVKSAVEADRLARDYAFDEAVEREIARRIAGEHLRGVRDGVGWVAESLAAAWQQSTDSDFLVILRRIQDAAAEDVAAWLAEGEDHRIRPGGDA